MERAWGKLLRDERGATSIEYALIGTLVSVALITALTNFSESMGVLYTIIDAIAGVIA